MSFIENNKYEIASPIGTLVAEIKCDELVSLVFIDDEPKEIQDEPEIISLLKSELNLYFEGKLKEFSTPLNPQGTDFQKEVWTTLQQIPIGKTFTYKALSEKMNNPLAIRAIAAANGANPVAILIPCHRVIGSDGNMTGYAWGIERKRKLLQIERSFSSQIDLFS